MNIELCLYIYLSVRGQVWKTTLKILSLISRDILMKPIESYYVIKEVKIIINLVSREILLIKWFQNLNGLLISKINGMPQIVRNIIIMLILKPL